MSVVARVPFLSHVSTALPLLGILDVAGGPSRPVLILSSKSRRFVVCRKTKPHVGTCPTSVSARIGEPRMSHQRKGKRRFHERRHGAAPLRKGCEQSQVAIALPKKEIGGAGTGKYQYQANVDGSYQRLTNESLSNLGDEDTSRLYAIDTLVSQRPRQEADLRQFEFEGQVFTPGRELSRAT